MAEIAVAGAAAILQQTISFLGKLAAQEGDDRLSKLKEEIGWVQREMGYIQTYLRNADSLREERENTVEAALGKDIRVLAYDVEDIVETYFPLIETNDKSVSSLAKIKSATFGFLKRNDAARKFLNEIEGIKRRVEDIRRVKETYGSTENNDGSSRVDIWEQRKHFLYLNESKLVGFDKHIETLVGRASNPQHPVISIVGMAGLGKTTLAKKVYNWVKPQFDCSAMVYMSQTPNISQLLHEVAKQVGMKCEEDVEVNLRAYLEGKRYVIVFDDIWDSQTWDYFKICIPNNFIDGSKLIITSRKTEVAAQIGTVSSLYELKPWEEEVSWDLFRDLVINPLENARVISDFHELETLGRKIVEKCGGVPLAIEVVAGLLLGKEATENEWEVVLKRMGQDEDKCSKVLRLSYKDLPIELKPCFLYFGFFPEDYEVSAPDIINIWVAEGFLQGKRDLEPEDVGKDYLNQLVARNMVQVSKRRFDGSIRTCRIHDLWHTFCITVGTETGFFNTYKSTISKTRKVRRVIVSNKGMEDILCHDAAKLRAVLYYRHNGDHTASHIHKLFKKSKCLRVLMLEFDDLASIFMKGIGSSTNLKYLSFLESRRRISETSNIRIPPTIGNLKGLMTLDLRNIAWVIFPDEIWQMKHLRHILLNPYTVRRKSSKIPTRKHEVSLPNLQTLHFVPSYALEAKYMRGFTNLRKLGISRPTNSMIKVLSDVKPISDNLMSLLLHCDSTLDATPMDFSRYQSLCKLSLHLDKGLPPRSTEMPPNLVKLTLHLAEVEDDPIQIWKSLPKLKIFKLNVVKYKRGEMVCSGGSEAFPNLEVLELDPHYSALKFIIEEHAMPKLKRLKWIKRRDSVVRLEVPERIKTKFFEEKRKVVSYF